MPPAVALLNYTSRGILWQIFCQTGIFAGFSLHIINFAVRISAAAMAGDIIFLASLVHWEITLGPILCQDIRMNVYFKPKPKDFFTFC